MLTVGGGWCGAWELPAWLRASQDGGLLVGGGVCAGAPGSEARRLGCAGVFVTNLVFTAHSSLGLTAAP